MSLAVAPGPVSANGWEHGAIPFEALVRALEDDAPAMRARAAHSFGLRGQQRGVGPLLARLDAPEPDPTVRAAIFTALGRLGASEAGPAVLACLEAEPVDEVRAACAGAAGGLGGSAALAALLDALEEDPAPPVRSRVLESLGTFSDADAVAALAALVSRGSDASLRGRAIRALGRTGATSAAEPLLAALDRAQTDGERTAIADALGRVGDGRARTVLERLAQKSDNPNLRLRATVALAALEDGGAARVLIELLRGADPHTQVAALGGLRRLGDPELADAVLSFYRGLRLPDLARMTSWSDAELSEAFEVLSLQIEALRALTDLDPAVGLDVFLEAAVAAPLGRASQRQLTIAKLIYERRRQALYGLGYTDSRAAGNALAGPAGLGSPDPRLRAVAVRSLGVLGDLERLPELIDRLADEVPDVRSTAAKVLGRLGDKAAVVPLLDRLQDPMERVRVQAALALGYLGDPSVAARLSQLAREDRSGYVREAARHAAGLLASEMTDDE